MRYNRRTVRRGRMTLKDFYYELLPEVSVYCSNDKYYKAMRDDAYDAFSDPENDMILSLQNSIDEFIEYGCYDEIDDSGIKRGFDEYVEWIERM